MEIPIQIDRISVSVRSAPRRCGEFVLESGEITRISAGRAPVKIECLGGVLWVTKENDPRDYLLTRGQSVTLQKPGRILIQSLPRGTMCITTV